MNNFFNNKHQARELRRNGKSYSEILQTIKVSKSTLSLWLRDIPLSNEQKSELHGRSKSRYLGSQKRLEARISTTKKIIKEAKTEVDKLISDHLFLSGTLLYWAEGTKRGNEMINFSNSDPNMIELMMKWFRKICKVRDEKIKIQIHLHELLNEKEVIDFWGKKTKIPLKNFHKLIIKKSSLAHRKNPLYFGTCCIRIYDVKLFRKMLGWRIGVLNKFGLKEEIKI